MAKPYAKLHALMTEHGDNGPDAAAAILLCASAFSQRMNNHKPWKIDEMYKLMDRYGVPYSQMHEVFPKMGRNE